MDRSLQWRAAMTSMRSSLLCLCFANLAGCAAWHERHDDSGTPSDVSDDGDPTDADADSDAELDDDGADDWADSDEPDVPTPTCRGALPDRAPFLVARDIPAERVVVGPCGELAYGNDDGVISLHDATFARRLGSWANVYQAQFSPDGAQFMATGQGEMVLYDLEAETSQGFSGEAGFLQRDEGWQGSDASDEPRSIPFLCDGAGLGLIRGDVIDTLFPGLACAPGSSAIAHASAHGSRVVLRDENRRLHVADFASGTDWLPPLESAEEPNAFDVLHLSGDGRVLVHIAGWDEDCGDTFCPRSDGTATVFDLAAQEAHRVPAWLDDDRDVGIFEGPPGSHRLAIQGASEATLLSFSNELVSREHRDLVPLEVLASGDAVLGMRHVDGALELVRFGGGSTEITPTSEPSDPWDPPGIAVSHDGSVLAYVAFRPKRCDVKPELREGCSGQLWETVVWSREGGELASHLSSQPPGVHWVGDDGSVLIDGPLSNPDGTDASPWGLRVLGTDRSVRTTLVGELLQLVPLRSGFLAVMSAEVPGGASALQRFDIGSGSMTLLERPASVPVEAGLHAWVDAAEERLVYAFDWHEGGTRRGELYAGRLR
jgi:hypothetical protein